MMREEDQYTQRYLMFPKKKRCGRNKGRIRADGQKEWGYINK